LDERGEKRMRLRIVKREPLPGWARVVIPFAAVAATLILSAIPILIAGGELWKSYFYLFYGALGTRFNLLEPLSKQAAAPHGTRRCLCLQGQVLEYRRRGPASRRSPHGDSARDLPQKPSSLHGSAHGHRGRLPRRRLWPLSRRFSRPSSKSMMWSPPFY